MAFTKEQLRQMSLEKIEKYRPIDDTFMRIMFRDDIAFTESVLKIILGIDDLKITKQDTQFDMKSLNGTRSLSLDVFATDSNGKLYNIEVQKSNDGASPKRARFHSSILDVNYLQTGDDFESLPTQYVIFITEHDVLKQDKLIYKFKYIDQENNLSLDDGTHIIYVNGAYDKSDDNSDLAKLVHDFRQSKADNMKLKLIADKTRGIKEDKEACVHMCKLDEDFANKLKNEFAKDNAITMLQEGILSHEKIAQYSGLPLEEIKKLAEDLKTK